MAQVREYGYYIVGNTIKLVERDVNFDNDANSKSYGPGVDRGEWKSPLSAVTNGLQLEYTYTPTYRINDLDDTSSATDGIQEHSGLLKLVDSDGSALPTAGTYFVLEGLQDGLDIYNGLHEVSSFDSGNAVILKTKYNGANVSSLTGITIYKDVSVMEDESFELDLPENLNLALEYYLKAKVFEQAGDFEKKEYFLKEFRKLIERHASTRQWGAKMIASGPHAIR